MRVFLHHISLFSPGFEPNRLMWHRIDWQHPHQKSPQIVKHGRSPKIYSSKMIGEIYECVAAYPKTKTPLFPIEKKQLQSPRITNNNWISIIMRDCSLLRDFPWWLQACTKYLHKCDLLLQSRRRPSCEFRECLDKLLRAPRLLVIGTISGSAHRK